MTEKSQLRTLTIEHDQIYICRPANPSCTSVKETPYEDNNVCVFTFCMCLILPLGKLRTFALL